MKKLAFVIMGLLLLTMVSAYDVMDTQLIDNNTNYDLVKYLVLVVGFGLGYLLYETFTFRAGGVIAVPLLVVYTMYNISLFFLIMVLSLAIYLLLELIFNKMNIYGRRLLYTSALCSIGLTAPVMIFTGKEFSLFLTLVPGLFAYNFHREKNTSADIMASMIVTVAYAAVLMGFALVMILI